MGTVSAHGCRLTRTNSGGHVAICRCGWTSGVHLAEVEGFDTDTDGPGQYDPARRDAWNDWDRHRAAEVKRAREAVPDRHLAVVRNARRYGFE